MSKEFNEVNLSGCIKKSNAQKNREKEDKKINKIGKVIISSKESRKKHFKEKTIKKKEAILKHKSKIKEYVSISELKVSNNQFK